MKVFWFIYLVDFEPELIRPLLGEVFFGAVFFITPSCSFTVGFLFAERYLIEKFNASFSVVGDDRKSFVEICWCSFLTTLFTLNGKIVFVSTSCSLLTKTQDFWGDNGTVVVFVWLGDFNNDDVFEDIWGLGLCIWWWWWVCKWNVKASFFGDKDCFCWWSNTGTIDCCFILLLELFELTVVVVTVEDFFCLVSKCVVVRWRVIDVLWWTTGGGGGGRIDDGWIRQLACWLSKDADDGNVQAEWEENK